MSNLKKLTKQLLSCVLALAMVVTSITVIPTFDVSAATTIDHFDGEGSFESIDPAADGNAWSVECDDWDGVSFGKNSIDSWYYSNSYVSELGSSALKFWVENENENGVTVTVTKTFAVLSAGTYTISGYVVGKSNEVDDMPKISLYRGVSGSEAIDGTGTATDADGNGNEWTKLEQTFTLTEAVYNYTVGIAVNLYYTSWGYVDGFKLTGPEVDEADELDYDFVWHDDWNEGYGMYEYTQPEITVEKGATDIDAPSTISAALEAELPNDMGTYSTWGTADVTWETDGDYGLSIIDTNTVGEYYIRGTATYGSNSTDSELGYVWLTVKVIPVNILANPGFEDYEADSDDEYAETTILSDWVFWDDEEDRDSKSTSIGCMTECPRSGLANYSMWADASYTYNLTQEVEIPEDGLYKFSYYYVGEKVYYDTDEESDTYESVVGDGSEVLYAFTDYNDDETTFAFTGDQDDGSYVDIYSDYYLQLETEAMFFEKGTVVCPTIYIESPDGYWVAVDDAHFGCWVEMGELKDAIDAYKKLDKETYTEDSWENAKIEDAYKNALALYGSVDATQSEVNEALSALETAMDSIKVGYAVKNEVSTNGSISQEKAKYAEGEEVTVTATPDKGYVLDTLTVVKTDDEDISYTVYSTNDENVRTFIMPAANVTCTATFVLVDYIIAVDDEIENGTVLVEKDSANYGDKVGVLAEADDGYELSAYYIYDSEGEDITDEVNLTASTGDYEYEFTMPASDITVSADFDSEPTYNVKKGTIENGSIKFNKTVATKDTQIVVTATGDAGYELDTVYVDGKAIEGTTFTMPEKDVVVTATFKTITYNISVDEPSNGTATASQTTGTVLDTITVYAVAATGYELDTVYVNGKAIEGTTFAVPAADVVITVTFKAIDYDIKTSECTNGSVAISKAIANIGDEITVTATPATGYVLDTVYVDGKAIEGTTFKMPAADVVVSVSFKLEEYDVLVNGLASCDVEGASVSVKVNGKETLNAYYGDTVSVTVTPSTNYELKSFVVKPTKAGSTALSYTTSGYTYTFTMPAGNVNASVTMSEYNMYTFYYYYDGTASPVTLAFSSVHSELGTYCATYWGKYCYKMIDAGNGWWKLDIREDWGEFTVVINPQNELETNCADLETGTGDLTGTAWKITVSSTSGLFTEIKNTGKETSDHVVYFYKGRVFASAAEAISAGNTTEGWTYYVSGGSTNWQEKDAGIFSNYFSTNYKLDETTGEYTSTGEAWKDVLTRQSKGVYTVNLGKAVKGTSYEFNVYAEKLWDNKIFSSNAKFTAAATGYVQLTINVESKTYSVKYFADEDCTSQMKLVAPTLKVKQLAYKSFKNGKGNLGKIRLSWSSRANATKYYVYMYSSATKKWKKIKTTTAVNFTYKKLAAGKTYKFKVVAVDGNGRFLNSDASNIVTVKTAKNIAKKKAVVKRASSGKISITWNRVSGASGYIVYKYNSKTKKYVKVKTIANKSGKKKFTYVNKKASNDKTYKYKIVTYRNIKVNGKKVKVLSKSGKNFTIKKK